MEKRTIYYILAIVIVLMVVVLSQQPVLGRWGANVAPKAMQPGQGLVTKGASWVNGNVASKIGGEVQKRGEIIQDEIEQEKKNISENILEKTKNYFSGVANSILHPGTPQNCKPSDEPASGQPNP